MDKSYKEYWEGTRIWGEKEFRSFDMIMKDASCAFPKGVWEMMTESFECLKGQKVLIPSCGDGLCALGFCRLESFVMATDFCSDAVEQVKNKAHENGLDIKTKILDSKSLKDESNNKYDLVFTSYGVLSCMTKEADLEMMFKSFNRVLKPNGRYILFDFYPPASVFKKYVIDKSNRNHSEHQEKIEIDEPYWEVRWKIEDYLRTLLKVGFVIMDFREMPTETDSIPIYKGNTYIDAIFPSWVCISVKKN